MRSKEHAVLANGAARPAPVFRVQYQRYTPSGPAELETYEMAAPPQFAPGFVIFTALSGTQMAYPAQIFLSITWSVK